MAVTCPLEVEGMVKEPGLILTDVALLIFHDKVTVPPEAILMGSAVKLVITGELAASTVTVTEAVIPPGAVSV
jgi:hypothetical protein